MKSPFRLFIDQRLCGISHQRRISIRLDTEVLEYFQALSPPGSRPGYKDLINAALREYMVAMELPKAALARQILDEVMVQLTDEQRRR